MKAKAGAEAQRPRNRRSEPQFDGVVACGDLALQPFQAGERVGSGPVLIGSPWGDQVGAQVQVLLWSRGGTIRICDSVRQKYPTQGARHRFPGDKCRYSVLQRAPRIST